MSELQTYKGRTQSIRAWALEYGAKPTRVYHRLRRGWNFHDALTKPASKNGMTSEQAYIRTAKYKKKETKFIKLEYKGKSKLLSDWAKQYGLSYSNLYTRIHMLDWPLEKALTTKPRINKK